MFLIWLLFYYHFVLPSGSYYTFKQTFTDSNYYDYHALKLSTLGILDIIEQSNITWQSTFVISFYAFVYKFFGQNLINPILVNLILIYLSLFFLKIRLLSKFQKLLLLLFVPFFAINIVVVGKDTLTVFMLSIFLKEFYVLQLKSLKRNLFSLLNQITMLTLSTLNRVNSLPIFLTAYIVKIKRLNTKTIFTLLIFTLLLVILFLNQLSQYLDISFYINMQRQMSNMPSGITALLLPYDLTMYFLMAPIRMIAFLISPFPLLGNVFNFQINDSLSYFNYFFFLFKFLSGMAYFLSFFYVIYLIRKKILSLKLIFPFLVVTFFISSVHLVEGGRYRVICDVFLIWMLVMSQLSYNVPRKKSQN
jgi:hypothetical protein